MSTIFGGSIYYFVVVVYVVEEADVLQGMIDIMGWETTARKVDEANQIMVRRVAASPSDSHLQVHLKLAVYSVSMLVKLWLMSEILMAHSITSAFFSLVASAMLVGTCHSM